MIAHDTMINYQFFYKKIKILENNEFNYLM